MRLKTIVGVVLLVFVGVTLAWLVRGELALGEARAALAEGEAPAPDPAAPSRQLVVYYFHTTIRCPSCLKIEELTSRTVTQWFDGPVREGVLAWRPVNIDEPEHEHFIDEYELTTKTVVVVDVREGQPVRWKKLERTWDLLGDDEAFVRYVRDEVGAWLPEMT